MRSCRLLVVFGLLLQAVSYAQRFQEPGKPIGTISTQGNLIVMTLDEGVLGKANLFDLDKRTLRFTPEGAGYRAENVPLQWDADFGSELTGSQAPLHKLTFPFSGRNWDALSVGVTGSIAFGAAPAAAMGGRGGFGGRGGGVSIGRFDQLQEAARNLVNTVPAICVFMKPRMSGHRYVKELDDRVLITWDLTEPYGNIQDFTWTPTVNRFQAALHKDGMIEMSYNQLAARDAIVGVYPVVSGANKQPLGALESAENAAIPANLDIRSVKLAAVGGVFLKATIETRGAIPAEAGGAQYRVRLNAGKQTLVWTIRGIGPGMRGGRGGAFRYFASGPGVSPRATVDGNTISIEGTLPQGFNGVSQLTVSADATAPGASTPADEAPAQTVKLAGIRSPEVDFAAVKKSEGPFTVAYESFHYLALPNMRDLTCTVIKSVGDKFDFLAYYSDFRVDNQEAGTPSNGPLGGNVSGIGQVQHGLENYCSAGRFQWQFIQPVYVGSNQMQAYPPKGVTSTNTHDIATYEKQLGERSTEGKMLPYNYAMSQIGHEMGHRWSAFVSGKVNGETIVLGPTHWARGLQAPVAFPYQRPTEASAMGGGVWQDNFDGTFTQLDDDYYVPATGWSYLDLYLMGLISPAEVPDFFILRNLVPAGRDGNGHPIFKADRTKVTIEDVIAVEGPRMPPVEKSQRNFNTGMVVVVEHGKKPSRELIERTNGIREQWMQYWAITTGRRSTMTTNPR